MLNQIWQKPIKKSSLMDDRQIIEEAYQQAREEDDFYLDANKPKETESEAGRQEIATYKKAKRDDKLADLAKKGMLASSLIEDEAEGENDEEEDLEIEGSSDE